MDRTSTHPRTGVRGFLFLVLLLTAGCAKSQPDPHVLGHVAARSGPDQAAGLRQGDAVALAVNDVNVDESRWIDKRPVAVIHGDAGADLDGFAFQATRLVAVNRVEALIGGTTAAELEKLVPVVQSRQIVLVSASGGGVGQPSKLAYCVGIEPSERGRVLGQFAAEERRLTDVAVVVDAANPVFTTMAAAFLQQFRSPDRKVNSEIELRNDGDLPAAADRLAKAKPQAVLFAGRARDLIDLRTRLQKAGVGEGIVVMFAGEEEDAVFQREPDAARGVIWTTAFTEEDPAETVQKFCTAFRTRTQQAPDVTAALSYDAARILFAAALRAKTFRVEKPDKLRDELKATNETGGLTGPFRFTAKQTARRTVYVVQRADGKVKLLKSYAPENK